MLMDGENEEITHSLYYKKKVPELRYVIFVLKKILLTYSRQSEKYKVRHVLFVSKRKQIKIIIFKNYNLRIS